MAKLDDPFDALSLADALAATDIGTWSWNAQTDEVSWSPVLEAIFGFAPGEFDGSFDSYKGLLHPEDRQPMLDAIRQAMESNEKFRVEHRIRRRDGTVRWVDGGGQAVRNDSGETVGMIGTAIDITDSKRAGANLVARLQQQAALTQLGEDALGTLDLQAFMDRTVAEIAAVLDVDFCKILERRDDSDTMLLRAGIGWQDGVVGHATVGTGLDSQAGFTVQSPEPVIVDDMKSERRFSGPRLLHDHGVVSGISTVIGDRNDPYGVIGAHSRSHRRFARDDVTFLQAAANLVGLAIQRHERDLTILQLSTPVLRLMPRVLLVPLIGQLNQQRVEQFESALLEAVRKYRASLVIIDVTAAETFDAQTTASLTRAFAAAQLLGADVLISGISPRLANELLPTGLGLRNARTIGDLQSAIQETLDRDLLFAGYRETRAEELDGHGSRD